MGAVLCFDEEWPKCVVVYPFRFWQEGYGTNDVNDSHQPKDVSAV
jgi:hypothetical protein